MDIEIVRNWAGTIALLISATSVIVVWVKSPGQMISRRLRDVADSLKLHDRRIQALEHEVKHLPTNDDFAALQITAVQLQTELRSLKEMMNGMNRTVLRIDDYLRENR